MIKLISVSEIGPAHIEASLPNQDFAKTAFNKNRWAVCVADGMGSRAHSDIGSRLAATVATSSLLSSSETISSKDLVLNIYRSWLSELESQCISSSDAVTTLLCAWGDNSGHFRYMQLGDGVICSSNGLVVNDNSLDFGNETTGLGLSKKLSDWRFGEGQLTDHDVLILMTDGISEDILDIGAFASSVKNYVVNKNRRRVKTWLQTELRNWATPCHTDDKTLSMVVFHDKK